jgi:hypothetical protein
MAQLQLLQQTLSENDVVYTPEWAALDIVTWFKPTGRILEPCKGQGAIFQYLPGAEWCEIAEGKDFFAWNEPVDWIISNPPYSIFTEWLEHSFTIAPNIVYLFPLNKLFNGNGALKRVWKVGWMKHIRFYGTGGKLNFPMGNAIGAVHFVRGWWGETSWSWYDHSTHLTPRALDGAKRTAQNGSISGKRSGRSPRQ